MMKLYMHLIIYMIMFMLILSMIINSLSLNNKMIHPTTLGLILIIFSMLLSLNLSIYFINHWFSYIMFLTIVSGMMILFMYFMSFINNMKMMFKMSILNLMIMNFSIMIMMFYMIYKSNFILWINSFEIKNLNNLMDFNLNNNFMKINYMYNYNKNFPTLISMIYLFICLTMIVKICLLNKYSIRKIN